MLKYKAKFQKESQGKSALLFNIQKRGFQYRYCFHLFQHILFIQIQSMPKYKITKTFVINYCVLYLSKICKNSSHPSFQLLEGYDKFFSRMTYSKYSTSSSSTSSNNKCSIPHKVPFLGICGIYL